MFNTVVLVTLVPIEQLYPQSFTLNGARQLKNDAWGTYGNLLKCL